MAFLMKTMYFLLQFVTEQSCMNSSMSAVILTPQWRNSPTRCLRHHVNYSNCTATGRPKRHKPTVSHHSRREDRQREKYKTIQTNKQTQTINTAYYSRTPRNPSNNKRKTHLTPSLQTTQRAPPRITLTCECDAAIDKILNGKRQTEKYLTENLVLFEWQGNSVPASRSRGHGTICCV